MSICTWRNADGSSNVSHNQCKHSSKVNEVETGKTTEAKGFKQQKFSPLMLSPSAVNEH
jgi:hypothetical protein